MIEAQVHCGLENPGVGFGLHGRGEVVPLDGHQRDEAADPVRGRGGVEAWQDKEAGVGAGVRSGRGCAWRAEGPQGLGGGLVHDPVHCAQCGDAAAVGQGSELDGLRVADELCCFGLDFVEKGEGRGRGAEPDGAAVFHAGADVGLVDGRQRWAGEHVARAPQVSVC